MASETITVLVGGQRYNSWMRMEVHASFKQAVRSFSFSVAAEQGASAANALFQLGTALEIYAGSDLLVSGYVNSRLPKFSKLDALIEIAGRSKGQDHVDSTAMHETGWFQNQDPLAIGNALGTFGAKFTTNRQLDKLDYYQVTPGDTVFDAIEDLCRDQGMTLCGQPNGDIMITDASQSNRHAGGLYEGVNMEEAEGQFGDENRHSETHLRGQLSHGHGTTALRQHAVAKDASVKRHRPQVHHHHGNTPTKSLQKRAEDRRNRKAGNAVRATVATPSWRDQGGTIWTPGKRIWTQSPFLDLSQDMLLEGVTFSVVNKDQGVMGHLALVDPQAYGGKAGKAAQSGDEWSFDASAAQ